MSKHIRGSNTNGYGVTKSKILDAAKRGLSYEEMLKETGFSGSAIRSCAARNGIRLKTSSGRSRYGSAKDAAHHAWTAKCSIEEAAKKFKCKPESVRRNMYDYKKDE